jgi:hypothetical protein
MYYSEWKKIYKQSGEVAAVLCINELSSDDFIKVVWYVPELAHHFMPERMTYQGVAKMLNRDRDWLKKIDSRRLTIEVFSSLWDKFKGIVPNYDTTNIPGEMIFRVVSNFPTTFEYYRDAIFNKMEIGRWLHLCSIKPELAKIYDAYELVGALNVCRRNAISYELIVERMKFEMASLNQLMADPQAVNAFITKINQLYPDEPKFG